VTRPARLCEVEDQNFRFGLRDERQLLFGADRGPVPFAQDTSEGQPGKGTVERAYRFVLGHKFLHERNVSTCPPQPKKEKGEIHEHWSFFSHDRARRILGFRQFHQEGFVNQYVMTGGGPQGTITFETEAIENIPAGGKARETYKMLSSDEFVETFELAEGDKPFEVYSTTRFKRTRKQ
jgi:hypothetical protein